MDKALNEPAYSDLYAQLCQKLDKSICNFEASGAPITTFRKLLLTVCQHEFDNRGKYGRDENGVAGGDDDRLAVKKKMLGNVKFIGELGRLDLLSEAILHKCIKSLLEKRREQKYSQMSDDLECLCKMMPTIGKKLDQGEAIKLMDQYFERMNKLRRIAPTEKDQALPQRIKFLLQDLLELRANGWVQRRTQLEQAPKTMNEVRSTAIMEEMAAAAAVASTHQHDSALSLTSAYLPHAPRSALISMYQQISQQPNMSLLNAINEISSKIFFLKSKMLKSIKNHFS